MLATVRIFVLAGGMSLSPLAGLAASELEQGSARSASIEVLKAGGRYMLHAVLCDVDRAPLEERVHDVIDRSITTRPGPKLQASHEEMDYYMAEQASQEYMKDLTRKCDADGLKSVQAAFETSIREFANQPQAR